MTRLSIREARHLLSHLDQLLTTEEEVVITRRGKAIARLMPLGKKRPIPSHRDLREEMARMRKGSEIILREDRDGR